MKVKRLAAAVVAAGLSLGGCAAGDSRSTLEAPSARGTAASTPSGVASSVPPPPSPSAPLPLPSAWTTTEACAYMVGPRNELKEATDAYNAVVDDEYDWRKLRRAARVLLSRHEDYLRAIMSPPLAWPIDLADPVADVLAYRLALNGALTQLAKARTEGTFQYLNRQPTWTTKRLEDRYFAASSTVKIICGWK